MKNLLSFAVLALLIGSAHADAPILVNGRALDKSEKINRNELKDISNGPSGVSQLFWDNQDNIKEEILESLTELDLEVSLKEDITDNVTAGVWADMQPSHRVIRINAGDISEDGVPNANTESYYLVVDQVRTKLRASIGYGDSLGSVGVGVSPISIEGGEIVRKLTPVRDQASYEENILRGNNKYFERFRDPQQDEKSSISGVIAEGARWTYGAVATVYEKVEDLFRAGSKLVADEDSTKIFFVVPFNGIRTKARMFQINSKNFLENVNYGETLDIHRYFTTGYFGVGANLNGWRAGYTPRSFEFRTQRTVRRVSPADCVNMTASGCYEVLLSMRYTIAKGKEIDIKYKHDIGPFDLTLTNARRRKNTFYEIEKIYRMDLSTNDGITAFNLFFYDFKPTLKQWENLPTITDGEGVQLMRTNWRGEGLNVSSQGRVDVGLYKRRYRSDLIEYPICFIEIKDRVEQEKKCSYSAYSAAQMKFANRIKWFRDNEANYVGMVGLTNAEIHQKGLNGDPHTANLHISIRYNDRNAEDYDKPLEKLKRIVGLRDYYDKLENIRIALALKEMPELYTQPGFSDVAQRVAQLENRYRDIEKSLQNMNLDIYMDEAYTKSVLTRTPEEVKATLDSFKISSRAKKDLLKTFIDAQNRSGEEQVKSLVRIYHDKGRKPYFAGLMLKLGRDHAAHAAAGHLAIRFRSEGADLSDAEKYKELIVGTGIKALEKKIFTFHDEFTDPDPGIARLSRIRVYSQRTTNGNKRIYLEFLANIKTTANGGALTLRGKFSKFRLFLADQKVSDILVASLTPYERVDGNYRYIVDLGEDYAAGLVDGDYTIQFQLEDASLSQELPSSRLTETREAAFSI